MEEKKRSRFKWLLYVTFWVALVVSFGWLAVAQASQYGTLQNDLARIQAETQRAEDAHELLQRQIAFIGSDAYIEQQARERLGLVKPTEIIFINIAHQGR
ncbi:MAG: septum formation initiator family protein [Defluviitaleaceae bacterium]|nr:septum formation initiator family protein [Defluviitaleaceae bacterium]MCL2239676.1 septum formation initiator family protein [Defluviitaleaceae bacterium]